MNPYMPLPVDFVYENDIPPRLQWNSNDVYCGEVSMISAGLYYGQYLSQYDVRAIASPKKSNLMPLRNYCSVQMPQQLRRPCAWLMKNGLTRIIPERFWFGSRITSRKAIL